MRKFIFFLSLLLVLSACTDKVRSPLEVAEQFWQSAQQGKMDAAKQMVSWETVGYLKYINDEKFTLRRVEFGEQDIQENKVTIDTVLVLERKQGSDVRIPTRTVIIKTEGVWRVQLKQTMTAVLQQTMNEVANQFNQMLRKGMQELNKALTGSVDDISKSLEEGARELGEALEGNARELNDSLNQFQQELEKKLPKPEQSPPSRKEI